MDAINKASQLYMHQFEDDDQYALEKEERRFDGDIHRYISIAVKSVHSAAALFSNHSIFDALLNSLYICVSNNVDVLPLSKAYKCLERYFSLLVMQPWKPEYKTLKTYGGFYKTNVKSVLKNPESIFLAAGYEQDKNSTMVYRAFNVDRRKFLILAFECFVASEICTRIYERRNQLRTVGGTLDDAIFDIIQESWLKNGLRNRSGLDKDFQKVLIPPSSGAVKKDMVPGSVVDNNKVYVPPDSKTNNAGNSDKEIRSKTIIYSRQPSPVFDTNVRGQKPEATLSNFKYKTNSDHCIPYIDEVEHYPKLSQATPEEHMRESLKLVDEHLQQPMSENWKYSQSAVLMSSNPASAVTYPPGRQPSNAYPLPQKSMPKMEFFRDEGIVPDMALAPKYDVNGRGLNTFTNSNEQSNSRKSVGNYSDFGLNSAIPYSNFSNASTSSSVQSHSSDMLSDTIYHPPIMSANSQVIATHTKASLLNTPAPPPIPSRHLKPSFSSNPKPVMSDEDEVDGIVAGYAYDNEIIQPNRVGIAPMEANVPSSISAAGFENKLLTPRSLLQMKSNSLKSDSKKLVMDNRATKSMDYSAQKWKCIKCHELNSVFDSTCRQCSYDPMKELPVEIEEKVPDEFCVKSCPACTYDNNLQAKHCKICSHRF